jgi:transcription antitermination factor NusG
MTSERRWYCIQIHPQYQKLAEYNLQRQEFVHFFGTRIIQNTECPLFRGYGFVNFSISRDYNWPKINNTKGVIRLLPANLAPVPFPRGLVEEFIANDPIGDPQVVIDTLDKYTPGAEVEYTPKNELLTKGKAIVVNLQGETHVKIFVPWISAIFSVLLVARDDVRLTGETATLPVGVR